MTKHKVAELDGVLLDTAVVLANGWRVDFGYVFDPARPNDTIAIGPAHSEWNEMERFAPSTDWAVGGPIIDREGLGFVELPHGSRQWIAGYRIETVRERWSEDFTIRFDHEQAGPTPLIAAMRAFVASKFGDEVELP
jgi:hypothetical protein